MGGVRDRVTFFQKCMPAWRLARARGASSYLCANGLGGRVEGRMPRAVPFRAVVQRAGVDPRHGDAALVFLDGVSLTDSDSDMHDRVTP